MDQDRLVSKSMRQYGSRRQMTDSKELSFKMFRLKVAGCGPNPGSFSFMWAIKRFYIFKCLKNNHSAQYMLGPSIYTLPVTGSALHSRVGEITIP